MIEQFQNSNIYQFMKKHNISSLDELSIKSKNNLEWFWESVDKDIGIIWDKLRIQKYWIFQMELLGPNGSLTVKLIFYKSSVEKFTEKTSQIKLHIILYLKMVLKQNYHILN